MIRHNIPLRPEWMVEADVSMDGGGDGMRTLLALPDRPSAVLTVNDLVALGAVNACRSQGLEIPHDISVVGFDDIAYAAMAVPPLTTVAQPAYELGARAAELFLRRLSQVSLVGVKATQASTPNALSSILRMRWGMRCGSGWRQEGCGW